MICYLYRRAPLSKIKNREPQRLSVFFAVYEIYSDISSVVILSIRRTPETATGTC